MPYKLLHTTVELGEQSARALHTEIIKSDKYFCLTFTLAKRMYYAPPFIQYKESLREIKKFFKIFIPNYWCVMATPETTQDHNIHWHIYGRYLEDDEQIRNKIKTFLWNNQVLGVQFSYRDEKLIIHDFDKLNGYPFKDIEKTKHYIQFNAKPYHHVFKSEYVVPSCLKNIGNGKIIEI